MMGKGGSPPLPSARSGFDRFPNAKPDTGLNTPVSFLLATGTGVTFLGIPGKRGASLPSVPEETAT
jgi:hypothetical protein